MKGKILLRCGAISLSLFAPLTVMVVSCNNGGKVNSGTEEETPTKQYTKAENKAFWTKLRDGINKRIEELKAEGAEKNKDTILQLETLKFTVQETYEHFIEFHSKDKPTPLTQNEIHEILIEIKKAAEFRTNFPAGWFE